MNNKYTNWSHIKNHAIVQLSWKDRQSSPAVTTRDCKTTTTKKSGFVLNDACSCIIECLQHFNCNNTLVFSPRGNVNSWRRWGISSIRSHHVTASKLVWPVSWGAAALAASCPSELPVQEVANMSATQSMQIKFTNNNMTHTDWKNISDWSNKVSLLTALGYGFL